MQTVWREIGDGVFVRHSELLSINVGAIVGAEGVLLVDTHISEAAAGNLLDELRRITSLPVRWVVNTHWHWDHTFGNGAFPDAEVWAHPSARDDLIAFGDVARREAIEWLGDERRAELEAVVLRPPDRIVFPTVDIDIGGRTVSVRHLGRGHTSGDVVVVPEGETVLFAGDLVEEGGPPMFGDAYPADWPATLDTLLDLTTGRVVPGHGAVVDVPYVTAQRAEIAVVAEIAGEAAATNVGADEADVSGSPYPEDTTRTAIARHLVVT